MECTQRWRQDALNHDPHCMIIALSANTTPEEISRCKEAGMQHYLTKPVYINQLANAISLAAEYQLERDITLQEQDHSSEQALLPMDDDVMRRKIRHSLHLLLCELEHSLGSLPKTSTLLHTLKGCLGQAGLTPLVCSIIDMENRVQHGLTLAKEEITEFRHILNSALDA